MIFFLCAHEEARNMPINYFMTFIVVAFHQVQTMCRKNRQFELQKTFQGENDVSIVKYSVQVQLKKGDFHKNLNEMLIKFDEKKSRQRALQPIFIHQHFSAFNCKSLVTFSYF